MKPDWPRFLVGDFFFDGEHTFRGLGRARGAIGVVDKNINRKNINPFPWVIWTQVDDDMQIPFWRSRSVYSTLCRLRWLTVVCFVIGFIHTLLCAPT